MDILQTVRDRPLLALGAVFGAGVLLALVSGRGGDQDGEEAEDTPTAPDALPDDPEARADLWERRARRLQRLARQQKEELRALRRKGGGARDGGDPDEDLDEGDEQGGSGGLAELFRAGLQRIVRSAADS